MKQLTMIRHVALPLVLCGWLLGSWIPVWAQSNTSGLDLETATAEQLLNSGINSYNSGNYAASEESFSKFLELYGESAEALETLPRLLPLLAISRIQQNKFPQALPVIERYFTDVAEREPKWEEEMMFWRGVCQLQAQDYLAAEKSLMEFIDKYPQSAKVEESILLVATSGTLRGAYQDTFNYLEQRKEQLVPFNQGRASVLQLNSLVQEQDWDQAMNLILREFPRLDEMIQIVAFQTLSLQVGSHFLDNAEYRKAIACLQRVWQRPRLLRHQRSRLEQLQARLEAAEQRTAQPFEMLTLSQLISKVEREITEFSKIENFDSALRLRLGTAYLAMQRYREAALIMDDMLERMDPDQLVEQASLNLVKCWSAIEQWPATIDAADRFAEKFPDSASLPMIMFMKAEALRNDSRFAEAAQVFEGLAIDHPKAQLAARSFFMKGFCELLDERNEDAINTFERLPKKFADKEIEEMAHYWTGMGQSFLKQHDACKQTMQKYLDQYPDGKYTGEATFRIAYCDQALQDFPAAIKKLSQFIKEFERHERVDEARLLLGEAYMATGELDKGITELSKVSDFTTKFFDEAQFKIGRALRLQEEHEKLRAHMQQFDDQHPASSRVPEAVYWIGWTHNMAEETDKAQNVYWNTIRELGPDPQRRAVTDLFLGLRKLYRDEEGLQTYLSELDDLLGAARRNQQPALELRVLWAKSQALARSDPKQAQQLLIEAASLIDPPVTNPLLMADIGDALREADQLDLAKQVYTDLRKWNPRAPQKDRAFAGLGLIAVATGEKDEAIRQFARFERETLGSPLLADILLAKAQLLLEDKRYDEALTTLESILAEEAVAKSNKAEALYLMGDIEMARGNPGRAVPFYQRVYVMYGRWVEVVAKSYLRSGEAFEKLNRTDDAVKTYEEMLARDDLLELSEAKAARQRLESLKKESSKA